jgi:uncharacterized membrane protein YfcA
MTDLTLTQSILVLLIFVWSGFVRTGLGFGGAMMALPLLLLVDNRHAGVFTDYCRAPVNFFYAHGMAKQSQACCDG